MTADVVNHPAHYNSHPSGVETIRLTEHMDFLLGNVIKYVMRCEHKGEPLQDLRKARFYLDRKISQLEAGVQISAPEEPAIGTAAHEALERLHDALVIEEPSPGPDVWLVYSYEDLMALPEGTRFTQDVNSVYFNDGAESKGSPVGSGHFIGKAPHCYPRLILNPEILGEFRPVEVAPAVPASLSNRQAYRDAPVGTIVTGKGERGQLEKLASGKWHDSGTGFDYSSESLGAEREVVRWGRAPWKVGDTVEVAEDLPVGIELASVNNFGRPGLTGYRKAPEGHWIAMSSGRPAMTPPKVGDHRRILALP